MEPIRVFTTRPDTLWGATFMVLAPEHPLVDVLTTPRAARRGRGLRRQARARDRDRAHEPPSARRPACSSARYAINPVNGERIPIWIADYVLIGLRHRRDHGRAGPRPARLRVRAAVRPADPRGGRAAGRRRRCEGVALIERVAGRG